MDYFQALLVQAIKSIDLNAYEGNIYSVRENADHSERPETESTWDHPDVVKYSKSCDLIRQAQEAIKKRGG